MKDSFRELLKKSEVEPSKGFAERLVIKIEAEKTPKRAQPAKGILTPIILLGATLLAVVTILYLNVTPQIISQVINFDLIKTPLFVLFAFLALYAVQQVLLYQMKKNQWRA